MDVRQLAPSLLALGEYYQAIQREIAPDAPQVALKMRATSHGSFEVHLELGQSLWEQVRDLFTSDDAQTVANIVTIGGSVIALLKYAASKAHKIFRKDDGSVEIEIDDSTIVTIPAEAVEASQSVDVRHSIRDVVEPLRHEGIEQIRLTSETAADEVIITAADLPAFEVPPLDDQIVLDELQERVLSIQNIAFKDGNKWKFSDGSGNVFTAAVRDEAFLAEIERNEVRFAKHDALRVMLHVRQANTADGLKSEYEVESVIEHIRAARQLPLPFDEA